MAGNPNDITAYRKKKKRREMIYKFAAISLIAFGIIFIWTNGETIFEPLRGIASKIDTSTAVEGFPIFLSGSASYSMNHFGTNFLLLTDTYLYTYTEYGRQNYAYRHNYSRPMQKSTDRRILLYNFNGHEFSLYNRSSQIYEKKLDDKEKIILAELGDNDMTAIVTTSTAYSNVLYIYDGNGKWRYTTRKFVDEEVNAISFLSATNEIAVATSTVENGEIISNIYKLRTDSKDDLIWKSTLSADAWALRLNENDGNITVLADNMIVSLNSDDGSVSGSYAFNSGSLEKAVFGSDFNLLVLRDYITGKALFVSLDLSSNLISTEIIPFEIKRVEISGEMMYTLTGDTILIYDKLFTSTGIVELEDEYQDFVKAGNTAILLGYDTVIQVSLEPKTN